MRKAAAFRLEASGGARITLSGDWTLATLPLPIDDFAERLHGVAKAPAIWDFSEVGRIDSLGAILLWRAMGRRWPDAIVIDDEKRHLLDLVGRRAPEPPAAIPTDRLAPLVVFGAFWLGLGKTLLGTLRLTGQLVLDCLYLARHPREIPLREFSATLYKGGALALPVTALVGFLIGVVISYLSAIQLRNFGADLFIVNILGVGIIREFGPVLVAVLVAGRSGSAMTAQLGVMRVTEEIDALATMGISRTLRLVLPRVAALIVAVPLLVVWTSAAGLFGGMLAAQLQLDLSPAFFIDTLPKVVPLANLWIGLAKGVVFGYIIAILGCHFGLHVRPNTESLSSQTTTSVVSAITAVILVDAIFAVATRGIGLPGTGAS